MFLAFSAKRRSEYLYISAVQIIYSYSCIDGIANAWRILALQSASCINSIAGTIAGLGVLPPLHTVASLLPSGAGTQGMCIQPSVPLISQPASAIPNTSTIWRAAEAQNNYLPQQSISHEGLVASLYLGDGVVPVPEKLMKKIWSLEYIEMNQLLPEAWVQDSYSESSSHCCHNASASKPKKGVSSIFSWIQCYSTLVSILAHKFPSKVPQLMAYQSIIVRCYTDYEGDGWLAYDRAYRRKAAYEKCLDWSKLNVAFYQFCLAGNAKRNAVCRICLRHDHQTADCNEADKNYLRSGYPTPDVGFSRPVNSGVEICRLYNAIGESKCKYKECRFAHLCKFCKKPHPASKCQGSGKPAKRSRPF